MTPLDFYLAHAAGARREAERAHSPEGERRARAAEAAWRDLAGRPLPRSLRPAD
ncbi:MAG: hypothetical protein M3N07_07320 [Pseudomonadota bacterium]|nr:hypothetical protein [Pseudomonadota bacterium]